MKRMNHTLLGPLASPFPRLPGPSVNAHRDPTGPLLPLLPSLCRVRPLKAKVCFVLIAPLPSLVPGTQQAFNMCRMDQ